MAMIREATVDDIPSLAIVHVQVWRSTYKGMMNEDYLNSLEPKKREAIWAKVLEQSEWPVHVADMNGNVVGFSAMCAPRDDDMKISGMVELGAINVLQQYAGQGLGRQLVNSGLCEAKQRGFKDVYLWVVSQNKIAKSFYEKYGFIADSVHKEDSFLNVTEDRYVLKGF